MIKHEGTKWILYTKDGSRKLGTHSSQAEAEAQERLIQEKVGRAAESRGLHLLGALGTARTEMIGSKEYLVVPVVALMEGVIHAVNAETPEFVPFETLRKAAESWNGKPITVGHPKKDGKQCSAQDPGIIDAVGIGTIRNSRADAATKKLLMEALIETSRAKRLQPEMYKRLADGGAEEVSVGAMVIADKTPGRHGDKSFVGTWSFADGDHLAFLPGGRGACSVEMGCGTHRAAMRVCESGLELNVEEDIRQLGISQAERDKLPAGDFAGPGQSYPIRNQKDVEDAAGLIGHADNPEAVKRKIIAIAKRKGLAIPDAWKTMKAAQAGDAEEEAELIAYQAMKTAYDAIGPQLDQLSTLINDLIEDETESPTETEEEEADEEQLETARIESIRSICNSIMGALSGISGITYGKALADDPRYMTALAGARHSGKDAGLIQAVHDHAMELGAQCDRGNMKTMEEHKTEEPDNPTRRYIAAVKKAG